VTGVDYNRRLYSSYRDGRVLSDDNSRLWMTAVDRHVGGARGNLVILDLGVYRDGSAASIPGAACEFDFAFMSMVVHHVPDLDACAAELYRVIKPGGAVFVRNTFSGRLDSVPLYRFFRSARAIDEARMPSVEQVRDTFRAHGFDFVALDTIAQQIDTSLRAHYERLEHRAISTFELMTDAEFHQGLERMRQAVELETAPALVVERIDLLVLRRQAA
jgi:ubiquinone/menaquinone biosynthesis C-methylase UbiE